MQTAHLGEPLKEVGRWRETDEMEKDFDASFLCVFLPSALSKGKFKDTLTLACFWYFDQPDIQDSFIWRFTQCGWLWQKVFFDIFFSFKKGIYKDPEHTENVNQISSWLSAQGKTFFLINIIILLLFSFEDGSRLRGKGSITLGGCPSNLSIVLLNTGSSSVLYES